MMNQKYKGILCILTSAFCFATMNMFVRLAGDLPSIEKSFFRNFVAMIISFLLIVKNNDGFKWNKDNLSLMMVRAIAGTVGILGNFYAIDHLMLSDATMLNKLSPFFAIIFSIFLMNEKVSLSQSLIVICAFIGALFVVKPTFDNVNLLAAAIGFLGGLGAGLAYTCVRKLGTKGEKSSRIVFFFSTFSCLVTFPYILFAYEPMTVLQLICLLCAGLAAAGGQFAVTAAYTYAPAKEISVYDYSQVIFAALYGLIMFGQIPDSLSIIGYLIIILMAIVMFIYNKRKEN